MDPDSFRPVILRYFAASFAGAAFAVAAVYRQTPGIDLSQLYNHHFSSMLLVNFTYSIALGIYLLLHTIFLGGRTVAFQDRSVLERLVNFFSSKFVFLGLVFDVSFEDMLYWLVWYAIIGLLKVLIFSAQSKFEQYIATASTSGPFIRGTLLLLLTLLGNSVLLVLVAPALLGAEWSAAALPVYDLACVYLEAYSPLYKYLIQLLDQFPTWQVRAERMSQSTTSVEVVSDVCLHIATLIHLLHVWRLCGIAYFVKDIVLTMHIHNTLTQLRRRWQAYTTLRSLQSALQNTFPDAEADDPQTRDMCAICLKPLENAKKLPCGHCLHASCIADMVRRRGHQAQTHVIKCPLCRKHVNARTGELLPDSTRQHAAPVNADAHGQQHLPHHLRSFFRFSTADWPRWVPIPGFSVEVLQRPGAGGFVQPATATAIPPHVEALVNNLTDAFPDVPRELVRQDILRTHNVHITTENILSARPPFDVQSLTTYALNLSDDSFNTDDDNDEERSRERLAPQPADSYTSQPIVNARDSHLGQLDDSSSQNFSFNSTDEPTAPAPVNTTADDRELRRRRALEAVERRWDRGSG